MIENETDEKKKEELLKQKVQKENQKKSVAFTNY